MEPWAAAFPWPPSHPRSPPPARSRGRSRRQVSRRPRVATPWRGCSETTGLQARDEHLMEKRDEKGMERPVFKAKRVRFGG